MLLFESVSLFSSCSLSLYRCSKRGQADPTAGLGSGRVSSPACTPRAASPHLSRGQPASVQEQEDGAPNRSYNTRLRAHGFPQGEPSLGRSHQANPPPRSPPPHLLSVPVFLRVEGALVLPPSGCAWLLRLGQRRKWKDTNIRRGKKNPTKNQNNKPKTRKRAALAVFPTHQVQSGNPMGKAALTKPQAKRFG